VVAKPNWNNANGPTNSTGQALLHQSGPGRRQVRRPPGIRTGSGICRSPIQLENMRMMRGYPDTLGGTTTVTVSALPENSAGYDVYADGDTRTGTYQDQPSLDHDDQCEPDGCGGHGLQRDIYAGEQFEPELREVQDRGSRVRDYGDAGSGNGWGIRGHQ
jgi:hypothetical protein